LHNEAIHDVLYTLHKARPISDETLSNDFERKCRRIAISLRWAVGICFVTILVLAGWPLLPWALPSHPTVALDWLLRALTVSGVLCVAVDVLPLARDISRFETYAYQQRQLVAAHDLANAATLASFTLAELVLAEKWLGLRIERSRLRLGIMLGGSDKVAILAVVSGAWTAWHNLPSSSGAVDQWLYRCLGAFIGGSGLGGILANIAIARMAYQRDVLALAICQSAQLSA